MPALKTTPLTPGKFAVHANFECFAFCFRSVHHNLGAFPGHTELLSKLPSPIGDLRYQDLPVPTTNPARLRSDLFRWGFCYVADALSRHEVDALKKRLYEQMQGEINGRGWYRKKTMKKREDMTYFWFYDKKSTTAVGSWATCGSAV